MQYVVLLQQHPTQTNRTVSPFILILLTTLFLLLPPESLLLPSTGCDAVSCCMRTNGFFGSIPFIAGGSTSVPPSYDPWNSSGTAPTPPPLVACQLSVNDRENWFQMRPLSFSLCEKQMQTNSFIGRPSDPSPWQSERESSRVVVVCLELNHVNCIHCAFDAALSVSGISRAYQVHPFNSSPLGN